MDKRTNKNISDYIASIAEQNPRLLKAYLFGSYARQLDKPESDIDVALVIENLDDDEKFDLQIQLMLLATRFDSRIEPHTVSSNEFYSSNPFIAEIKKTERQLDNDTKDRNEITELKEIKTRPFTFFKISANPLAGQFNVPYGKRNGEFLNKESLRDASEFLQNTKIFLADYLETLKKYAERGDFIFLDPPYYPVGKYSDFKRYTKEFFYHDNHVALKNEFDRLVEMGCHVVLTNSDHHIILELYQEYEINIIETKRLISSNPKTRNGIDIIVIGTHV